MGSFLDYFCLSARQKGLCPPGQLNSDSWKQKKITEALSKETKIGLICSFGMKCKISDVALRRSERDYTQSQKGHRHGGPVLLTDRSIQIIQYILNADPT